MVDDRRDCEDATQDADDIDEQGMPFVVGLYLQHSHRVGLIST